MSLEKGKGVLLIDVGLTEDAGDPIAKDTYPMLNNTFCVACRNLAQIFSPAPVHDVIRNTDIGTGPKNSLQPHANIAETRQTCGMCALLSACLGGLVNEVIWDMGVSSLSNLI